MPRLAQFVGRAGIMLGLFALASMALNGLRYATLPGMGL